MWHDKLTLWPEKLSELGVHACVYDVSAKVYLFYFFNIIFKYKGNVRINYIQCGVLNCNGFQIFLNFYF